ncbi:MAG: LLM class flavin-dependent oxidoreductase [Candidatus Flexifilum sp.]
MRIPIGVQIIPHIAPHEVVTAACEAEALGYASVWISDEGFMVDPFTVLGLIAGRTARIGLGVITNPYTRHPAMTASAIATLDQLSGGRAALCFVAGGSLVLDPIGIERAQPVTTVAEAIALTRLLLTGEPVTWQGTRFQLNAAHLEVRARPDLPIHVAARGEKMLAMAARQADAVWIGMDRAALAQVRAAAGERPVRLIGGDAPPIAAEQAAALRQAVAQDGEGGRGPRPSLADWGAALRGHLDGLDELLIVTWEQRLDALLGLLRAVKEVLA